MPYDSPPRPWQILRWIRILYYRNEVAWFDSVMRDEEAREAAHDRRMRSWRAQRSEAIGRLQALEGKASGRVSYSGMAGRNP